MISDIYGSEMLFFLSLSAITAMIGYRQVIIV